MLQKQQQIPTKKNDALTILDSVDMIVEHSNALFNGTSEEKTETSMGISTMKCMYLDEKDKLSQTRYASSDETASMSSFSTSSDYEIIGDDESFEESHGNGSTLLEYATASASITSDTFMPIICDLIRPPSCLKRLHHAVAVDFYSSGLPWSGMQCRSLMAGGSGALYLLPVLTEWTIIGKLWWIVQSFLSVQADYVHVHHSSIWHGLDHIAAIFTFVSSAYRACGGLDWTLAVPMLCAPAFFYAMAGRAKDQLDLDAWKWYHFGWHVVGSTHMAVGLYLIQSQQNVDS